MEYYIYSCQDLIIESNGLTKVKANTFYCIKINDTEIIKIYSTISSGLILVDYNILITQKHNHIIFHQLSANATICEIKPFVSNENIYSYQIEDTKIKIVVEYNNAFIYFKGRYYGCINQSFDNVKFNRITKQKEDYGIVYLIGKDNHIILFDNKDIIINKSYIDYEILKDYIQVYSHIPNIFNTGNLIKYDFNNNELIYKTVCDQGEENKIINNEFNEIAFVEALKSGRYKYAYNKLSYELKSEIDIKTLQNYFKSFDKYIYLNKYKVYVALSNYRITGIYHIESKNGIIQNIY
ncbi:MAG: hypothetical protein ACLRFE_02565 [Clostridia bacterium]